MNEEATRRVASDLGADVIERLASMPGADLTTAMIDVSRRRAEALQPADIIRRYRNDRFVGPGSIDPANVRAAEAALVEALPAGFEEIALSPVVPFGTHAMGGVAESRVIPTIRNTEVAADPTNGLALEAAVRRRARLGADPRSDERIRLAASQRVTRAQRFEDPVAFTHFAIFGLVTAGRDTGNLAFERENVAEHIAYIARAVRSITGGPARVTFTDWDGSRTTVLEAVRAALADDGELVEDRDRTAGRGYYEGCCFKVHAVRGDEPLEIADGGLVDWTQQLVASRKERLMISGLGMERLATLAR